MKIHISMVEAERKAILIINHRLVRDALYNSASGSLVQAERELEIECQVWRELEEKYNID
jgi:predicted metallo-beta-lactamase superfamily hydrolase